MALESRVRCLVADHLGVDVDDLVPETSLADELATDSLDLLELGLALEEELGISVSDRSLERVRTYGDLVRTAIASMRQQRALEARKTGFPVRVRARVVPVDATRGALIERSEWLTPYGAETIAEDALRAGPGARLEIAMAASCSAMDRARVQATFARLRSHGIGVSVRRHEP